MDSVGSATQSEDPPSPRPVGFIVNVMGTMIAFLTLLLPTAAVTYYSPVTLTVSSASPTHTALSEQSPKRP